MSYRFSGEIACWIIWENPVNPLFFDRTYKLKLQSLIQFQIIDHQSLFEVEVEIEVEVYLSHLHSLLLIQTTQIIH